jgi:hypothetical protein
MHVKKLGNKHKEKKVPSHNVFQTILSFDADNIKF